MATPTRSTPQRDNASRYELAYTTIRQRITSGVYGPGYRLVLDELAREIGTSPVPVREAVRRLEAEGYVDFQRNVGARVTTFNEKEFEQTFQVVALLEGYATALAAPHMRRSDIARARKINDEMRRALGEFDPMHFSALNREFHFTIYDRCPNTHVRTILEAQWSRLDAIRRSIFLLVPSRSRSSVMEHADLLRIIAAGASSEEIEHAARAHKLHTVAAVASRREGGAGDDGATG